MSNNGPKRNAQAASPQQLATFLMTLGIEAGIEWQAPTQPEPDRRFVAQYEKEKSRKNEPKHQKHHGAKSKPVFQPCKYK